MLIDTRTIGPFTVKTYAFPEDVSPRDCFDDELIDDVINGIELGRYEWFCAQVTAEWDGIELASEYLGACCYNTFEEFANGQCYHADMISEAVSQAEKRLREIADKASEALKLAA